MAVAIANTTQKSVTAAVADLHRQLSMEEPKMVIYFASAHYDPHTLSAAMNAAFPGVVVFGCTTAGEIVGHKMLKGTIAAMAFGKDIVEDVVVNIGTSSNLKSAFRSFESHYQISMLDADPKKYVGIVLCDGLSCAEESIMDKIGNLTDLTFIGGSAGDDLQFAGTYVFASGEAYTDSAVLALIKCGGHFDTIKTQSFTSLGKKLIATKVDEHRRIVYEFNGQPAAQAYAKAIGQPVEKLPEYFMRHPFGLMAGGELFVRSPQQLKDDSIVFFCHIKEGMILHVLQAEDIIQETRNAIKEKKAEMGALKALLNFNCILRTLHIEHEGLTEEYGLIFKDVPSIGFSTYGEAYIGHINQTATMLVFA